MKRTICACLIYLLLGCAALAQCPADSAKLDDASAKIVFEQIAQSTFNALQRDPSVRDAAVDEALQTHVQFFESWAVTRSDLGLTNRLVDLELHRWDKDTSSSAGAAGNTSVTSKGSVASLFSFAVDNGALTRSVSGTTLTFRTSPANVIAALQKGGWLDAGTSVPSYSDGSFQSIAKRVSFFVSFDASRGNNGSGSSNSGSTTAFTGDKQQLSGWGTRYEIINHRDPRDSRYGKAFADLMARSGTELINKINSGPEEDVAFKEMFSKFAGELKQKVLSNKDTVDAILADYVAMDPVFRQRMCELQKSSPSSFRTVNEVVESEATFLKKEADLFNNIARGWTLAAEYNITKQANTNGTLPASMQMVTTSGGSLPDLGNFNLVTSKGFSDGPQLTANASFTWFQSLPAGSKAGRIRDARISAQFDIPLKEIKQIGKPTVSISGLFLALLEQPIGQQVLVNTVPVTLTGNIGLVQGKFTIPTKSAVSIPLSVTWASRTELIKESDVRGNIGITFDLDKLFAKGETKQ